MKNKKHRSLIELYQLLLNEDDIYLCPDSNNLRWSIYLFKSGICGKINRLNHILRISDDEKNILFTDLKENLPLGLDKYNWDIGEEEPRINWIKKRMRQLQNN